MRIAQSTFNHAFGKQAVMTCVVKDKATGTPHNATLYKLDPKNEQDQRDVYFSKQAFCMSRDFENGKTNPISCREFYMLQNDKTQEVISCAQTLHRCRRPKFTHPGLYTMIEEANSNYKYKNGEEPLFAYIAKRAGERYDKTVFTAFNEDTVPNLKNSNFSETRKGEFCIPQRRFPNLINHAQKKYKMEYLG